MALLLAGCASEQLAATDSPPTSNVQMDGRWVLAAPNAPPCAMMFEIAADKMQGAIRPEGGCPGELFKSRRWQLAQGLLTINDRENQPLAQLKFAAGQFEGQSTDGIPVRLSH
jgi:Protease inhibitor Inh